MKRVVFSVSVTAAWILVFSGAALAHDFVRGQSHNGNVTLPSDQNWTVIRSALVGFDADAFHGCVATASADVAKATGAGSKANKYRFVLTRGDSNPAVNTGSERILELNANDPPVNDPDSKPVSTTQFFWVSSSPTEFDSTIYFLGRKVDDADADGEVLDASLSVICVDPD